ncbi:MAG: hypothetical protein R3F54_28360 [Alphaproteobacteria bacterium]
MTSLSNVAGACMALGLLAGCATQSWGWTKAGADQRTTAADLQQCRLLASDQQWRESWDSRWPPSFYDRHFMPPRYHDREPFWHDYPNSAEREWELQTFCMHSKGYRMEELTQSQS